MTRSALLALALCACVMGCGADGVPSRQQGAVNAGEEASPRHYWNDVVRKAVEAVDGFKKAGVPRVVPKGGKPAIILKSGDVYIDGVLLKFGGSFDLWKKQLGGTPRCSDRPGGPRSCIWDSLGLVLGTNHRQPTQVRYIKVSVNVRPLEPLDTFPMTGPSGGPPRLPIIWRPLPPFPGYLELDGFGIDAQTKYWEIATTVKTERNLHCGLRDCFSSAGRFGANSFFQLFLTESGNSGKVYELVVDDVSDHYSEDFKK